MKRFYDISPPLDGQNTIWPGDPSFERIPEVSIADGGDYNVSSIRCGSHAGAHVDAPLHAVEGGEDLLGLPLDIFVGSCLVVEHTGKENISLADVNALVSHGHERILFKTRNSEIPREGAFVPGYCALLPDAARRLVEMGVRLVGVDYLSVEPFDATEPKVHRILCEAGIVLLEGVVLSRVPPGVYELIALPLPIRNGEASPVRAVLREME